MLKPFIADHPLIQHKVTLLRDKNTSSKQFREKDGFYVRHSLNQPVRGLPKQFF